MDKIKLDIGAGTEPKGNGYIPIDKYYIAPGYICTDMWDLNMFRDGTVDEIYSSHTLEHCEKRLVLPTLKEWYRVLKIGGRIVIEVPDLVWCCQNWLGHRDNGWNMDALFGNGDPPGGQHHLTGFSHSLLQLNVEDAGFHVLYVNTVFNHAQNCIHLEALK
jgi:predicted SAM-dependent methyltransferase